MRSWLTVLATLWSEVRRRPGPALGGLLSIAVGVGVFVSIALAGHAARTSFVSAVDAVSGKATHEITALGGVAQERLGAIAGLGVVEAVQPILEGRVLVAGVRRASAAPLRSAVPPLRLLGIDPFRAVSFLAGSPGDRVVPADLATRFLLEPNTGFLSRALLEEAQIEPGDQLILIAAGRRVELTVLGAWTAPALEEAARDTLLVDLATAQEILRRVGALDRIELRLSPDVSESDAVARVGAALESGELLGRPERRGERLARMVDAFRLNLLALAGLALVVGALLVFGAAQFSVVRRGPLFGQLRSLGTSRRVLLAGILAETALVGALGGALGLGLGSLLARGIVGPVGQTVTDLYGFVQVELGTLDATQGLLVVVASSLLAVFAGAFPAFDAAATPPRFVGVLSRDEASYRRQLPRLLLVAAMGVVVSAASILWPTDAWWPGLLATFALLGAGACALPPILDAALPRLRDLGERSGLLLLSLAAGAVHRSLSRAGSAAGGLAVALAMMIGVLVMVGSFRSELDRWIERAIRADVFVADASQRTTREQARIPDEVVAQLRALPGLRGVDTLRSLELPLGESSAPLMGVEWSLPESRRFEILTGDPDSAVSRALAGALLVSEPLARHHDLGVGDEVRVPTRRGVVSLEIAGVFRDYSSDRGLLVTGARPFLEMFGDPGVRNAALWFDASVDVPRVVEELRREWAGRWSLEIRSNRELRTEVGEIFERTFAVTWVLQLIATAMALAGVAVTLNSLLLERRRELATLRALGMEAGGLARLFCLEALLLVAFPALVALPLGGCLAWILTAVINLRSFGWTIRFTVPWDAVAGTTLLALVAGLAAAALPIARARSLSLAAALREE